MKYLITFLISFTFLFTNAQTLTVEEAVMGQYGEFAPSSLSQLQWTKRKGIYSHVKEETLVMTQAKSGRAQLSLKLEDLNSALGLEMKRFPRISWKETNAFEFSHSGAWYRYDVKSKKGNKMQERPENSANHSFSERGTMAFTRDNNLYLLLNGKEVQVTNHPEGIVAGQAIARYEFGITQGIFWSPDGSKLGFYEKDERNVTEYPLVDMTTTPATHTPIRYPMAGSTSEIASFGIYDLRSRTTTYLNVNREVKDDSFYITNAAWTEDGTHLVAAIVNREQNDMKLMQFDAGSGEVDKVLFSESHAAYVEPEHPIIPIPNSDGDFLWFSERDGFNNLYRYSATGKMEGNSSATFPITDFVGFAPKNDACYVVGHGPDPKETHLYRLDLTSFNLQKITKTAGSHNASVSEGGAYILDSWSSLEVPRKQTLLTSSGKMVRDLHTADNPLDDRTIGKTEFLTIKAKDGTDLEARMITPPNMDSRKKYPVVVYVYNGPHVQLVRNTWMGAAPLWMHSLAGDGYIVFTVDGRGSSNRGRDFEQAVFRKLGTLEMQDQLAGAEYLKSLPYVDADRMAVHGWSFGGFMTTSLMLREPGTFKVGVAGGPVIDWSLYEVMYTERYMDTPQENPKGYDTALLTNYVDQLEGDLLMIHGTVDDVVVMQHNMRFLEACVSEGVQVDFFVYPGHPHNVRGKDRVHLMTKVIDYIKDHL